MNKCCPFTLADAAQKAEGSGRKAHPHIFLKVTFLDFLRFQLINEAQAFPLLKGIFLPNFH